MKGRRISVTVKPGSKVPGIEIQNDTVVVRVRERAVEGAANEAVLQAISKWLRVPPSALLIFRGAKSRKKVIEIIS